MAGPGHEPSFQNNKGPHDSDDPLIYIMMCMQLASLGKQDFLLGNLICLEARNMLVKRVDPLPCICFTWSTTPYVLKLLSPFGHTNGSM